jgi:hypothetical protein
MFKYCYNFFWQKKPIFIFAYKVRMGFDVTICKFRMHLSWHTLRKHGHVYYNCLFFNCIWHHLLCNCIWHLLCLSCMFPLNSHIKTNYKTLKGKKIINLKNNSLKYFLNLLQQNKVTWSIGTRRIRRWWWVGLLSSFVVEEEDDDEQIKLIVVF